jgi:Protein of unknown function (DUF3617)
LEYRGKEGESVNSKTILSTLALAAIGSGLIAAQGLNAKTGQWETTTTINLPGGAGAPALPPGALDRLPPDQRARIEAQLKAGQGRTSTSTRCVTKEDSAKAFQPANLPATCRYNLTVSTATQQKMTVTCESDKGTSTGTVQVDVVDAETIKGSVQMATAFNGQTMNTNVAFTSKWVGPACTETKSGK